MIPWSRTAWVARVRSARRRAAPWVMLGAVVGCAASTPPPSSVPPAPEPTADARGVAGDSPAVPFDGAPLDVPGLLNAGDLALEERRPAVALARFSAAVRPDATPTQRHAAFRGIARAHEALGDFVGAAQAWGRVQKACDALEAGARDFGVREAWLRMGAAYAEAEEWRASAEAHASVASLVSDDLGMAIEVAARRAYALFQLDALDEAQEVLDDVAPLVARAQSAERLSNEYFVGMVQFYRAAVLHRRFRAVPIRLPEARMARDFQRKLERLTQAQEAYNDTIRTRHVYWVSAAGYQLGALFEEFYDALMYAPVPTWLDDAQRQTYYESLKVQLRPVVNKAIWVYEKNLETAVRLGYDNRFVEATEQQLARVQGVLLSGDQRIGQPMPPLSEGAGDRAIVSEGPAQPGAGRGSGDGASQVPLLLPTPTML